ncbi:hypothetical protein Sme01_22830 [Sphaerisporangium melleum]|uniref:Cholesterol esterase n=1 Tax=Sphaerisporangium melleum TaxID=321316 RepID=A0A917QZK4_9ACTN|nr:hypothetical protein GCM10007964_21540 [Sphaerisporangium melleum]GII69807.1 hypothetical protein Sme01_22830 [Sphaerisporangium melleum]
MIFVPAAAAATFLVGAAVQGAIGASFVVAGTPIKTSAELVKSYGAAEFGSFVETKDGREIPVYVVANRRVESYNLCQSYLLPSPVGPVTIRIVAGTEGRPVVSQHQVTKATMLEAGHATYTDFEFGRDASTLDQVPGISGPAGVPGVQATAVVARNARQVFLATSSARLDLPDLRLRVLLGVHECF